MGLLLFRLAGGFRLAGETVGGRFRSGLLGFGVQYKCSTVQQKRAIIEVE